MIGVDCVANVMQLILDEKGDKTLNPVNSSGGCLYTDKYDADWHCLVGEYFVWIGITPPDHNVTVAVGEAEIADLLSDHTEQAISFLSACQIDADQGTMENDPWSYSVEFDNNYNIATGVA